VRVGEGLVFLCRHLCVRVWRGTRISASSPVCEGFRRGPNLSVSPVCEGWGGARISQ
jgi:hypothetical protein